MKIFISIAIFTLITSPGWATEDLELASASVCDCLEKPYAIAAKMISNIKQAQAHGDMSQLAKYQGEMMAIINASSECFQDLAAKYPEINKDPTMQSRVMAMADKKCPNPAETLFSGQ